MISQITTTTSTHRLVSKPLVRRLVSGSAMLHFAAALFTLLTSLMVLPLQADAQSAVDLAVTLRDPAGAGVRGVRVIVRDGAGQRELGQTSTDMDGRASIPGLPALPVRVAVRGALPDGTPLRQIGTDALGIQLFLDRGQPRLDLRVERSGVVLPDPATMIAGDVGTPRPTATSARPTALLNPSAPELAPDLSAQPTMNGAGWGYVALAGLMLLAGVIVMLRNRL
jgi:hypothetical protein